MKATGIVRRVEEWVIIGQTAPNPHKTMGFSIVCPIEHKSLILRLSVVFIHSNSGVENHSAIFRR